MSALFGRERELEAVEAWLATGARLLTVTGPPGVGKSRLAQESVSRHAGSVSCDLGACRSAADVERALQRALGGVSRARLSRALATFEGIVVLDRFEHLLEVARGVVEEWTRIRGPRFIIASREALSIAGETILVLGPLAEVDALALYAERARRRVDDALARSIVARLERLPLAIELAAARASMSSEDEVLSRLDRGVASIDPSSSLQTTIRWSLDLLPPAERATLLACAVFRGPFDARAAQAVALAPDPVACLVALERKSLIRRVESDSSEVPAVRVALYDAVREVALTELSAQGIYEAVAARHAERYLQLADAGLDARDPVAARVLANEIQDLGAAHAFLSSRGLVGATKLAIALDLALGGQAPPPAHVELLGAAIAQASEPVLEAKALLARARAHRLLGATRRATRDLREALRLARAAKARGVEADALRLLGVVARQLARSRRARVFLSSALSMYEHAQLSSAAAVVLDDLGVVAHDLGELATARDFYERALAAERIAGDHRFEGITLGHLGLIAYDFGDVDGALELYRDALTRHRETGDHRFEGFAHAFVAVAMLERGDVAGAQSSIEAAAAIDARLGDLDSGVLLAGIACAVAAAAGNVVAGREILARARLDIAARDDTALARMLDVFGMTLEVAEARRAHAEGRVSDEQAHRARVQRAALAFVPRTVEERIAHRVAVRLVDRQAAASVGADGTWFENGGKRVALDTRKALVRMLARLAAERRSAPGASLTLEALFEAGWPGERVPEASARRRVYVGIDTLRSLGLRSALLQRDRGYLLDPAVEIEV